MKRSVFLCLGLIIALASCHKDKFTPGKTVFEGKYLGEGCWPVIQVIKPSLESIGLESSKTKWLTYLPPYSYPYHDTTYFNAVGVGVIPDSLKKGHTFYFTVREIKEGGHVMDCTVPKYSFIIKIISKVQNDVNER